LLLSSCSRQTAVAQSSPEATVRAFLSALANGSTKRAAEAFDLEGEARASNEDWDSIPAGQRKLILGRMIDQKAQLLAHWAENITQEPDDIQMTVQGSQATAVVRVNGVSMHLLLVKDGAVWRISGIG